MPNSEILLQRQKLLLREARLRCNEQMKQLPYPTSESVCNRTWDGLMCWNDAMPGTIAQQFCPDYVSGLDPKKYARRFCEHNATWFVHPERNRTWTDYTQCTMLNTMLSEFPLIEWHLPYIRLTYNIGYGISLVALVAAMIVMMICRVRSKSNGLHLNLFIAFILRASISFIKENVMVEGIGLSYDVTRDDLDRVVPVNDSHWQCKLLFSSFNYSISLTHVWIFVEGLYLHTLVFNTLWIERHGIKPFVIIGWGFPLVIVSAWAIMRATREDQLCWNTTDKPEVYWILRGPVVCTVVINFAFFINIVRVLVSRARSPHRQMADKYKGMAKFTLTLIPLFGLVYIVYLPVPHTRHERLDLIYIYSEMLINSIQGFVLALLFCFLNEEVHNEIRKMLSRHRSRLAMSRLKTQNQTSTSKRYRHRGNNLDMTMSTCNELLPSNANNRESRSNSIQL